MQWRCLLSCTGVTHGVKPQAIRAVRVHQMSRAASHRPFAKRRARKQTKSLCRHTKRGIHRNPVHTCPYTTSGCGIHNHHGSHERLVSFGSQTPYWSRSFLGPSLGGDPMVRAPGWPNSEILQASELIDQGRAIRLLEATLQLCV